MLNHFILIGDKSEKKQTQKLFNLHFFASSIDMDSVDSLIKELKIADINFLMSLKKLKPKFVTKQIQKDVNHIAWIVGHCVTHMDSYLSYHNGKRVFSLKEREYYAYGVSKDQIIEYPYSFQSLIDNYLEISSEYFQILEELPVEEFNQKPHEEQREVLSDIIHRLSFHIMGHTGQIVIIRRMFDNPFWDFVGGVSSTQREELRRDWLTWWNEVKTEFP